MLIYRLKSVLAAIIVAANLLTFTGVAQAGLYFPDPILTITPQADASYLFHFEVPGLANNHTQTWHWLIISQDEQYFACNGLLGYAQPMLRDYIWDEKTSCQSKVGDGILFPPGHYHGLLSVQGESYSEQGVTRFELDIPEASAPITPTPLPEISPTPTPTPTPDPASALHPVLLIHGLTGYPELWQDAAHNSDYFALLKSWGYPADYIAAYHYSGVGVGKDGYNNQGDIPEMAAGMGNAIEQLHQASLARGGDGLVDIVCHSMGGLIARQYLKEHPADSHLGKVISVGTPYQGSWLMGVDDSFGVLKPTINSTLKVVLSQFGIDANPDSIAAREMTPQSSTLFELGSILKHPEIKYYTIFGSIKLHYEFSLFNLKLSSETYDVGDVVVLEPSATTVSGYQPSKKIQFSDTLSHNIPLALGRLGQGFAITSDVADLMSNPYFHNNLTRQPDVQSEIEKDLLDE